MAPSSREPFPIAIDTNGYSGVLSADAVGIVASFFALDHVFRRVRDGAAHATLARRSDALRAFVYEHRESIEILRAIN